MHNNSVLVTLKWLLPLIFSVPIVNAFLTSYACYMWCPSYPCLCDPPYPDEHKLWSSLVCSFLLPPVRYFFSGTIFVSSPHSQTSSICMKPRSLTLMSHKSRVHNFIRKYSWAVFQAAVGPYYLPVAQKGETSLKIALFLEKCYTLFNVSCVPQCSCNGKLYCTLQDFSVSCECI